MGFAILRVQKLKDKGSINRSFKHSFREQDTPNADPERTPNNSHIGATSSNEAMARFNARLPDKIRKNGVLAIEYLITGSPETMQGKTREEQDQYFSRSLSWLKKKHGAENVVYAGVHRDETTPHMYAFVVPLDEKNKLNCRSFLGGRGKLSEMQTEFHEQVAKHHGLERGIKGSKAKHQKVSQFYGQINQEPTQTKMPLQRAVVKKGLFSTEYESDQAFAQRIIKNREQELKPELEKAKITFSESRRRKEMANTNVCLSKQLEGYQGLFRGLNRKQSKEITKQAISFKLENQKDRRDKEIERENGVNKGFER